MSENCHINGCERRLLESELNECRAALAMRNSDLAEAVRLLDALLGLEKGSGEAAFAFVQEHTSHVGKSHDPA